VLFLGEIQRYLFEVDELTMSSCIENFLEVINLSKLSTLDLRYVRFLQDFLWANIHFRMFFSHFVSHFDLSSNRNNRIGYNRIGAIEQRKYWIFFNNILNFPG